MAAQHTGQGRSGKMSHFPLLLLEFTMKGSSRTLISLLLLAGAAVANAAELAFHDAWVSAAPRTAKVQAAYICFVNNSDSDVEITGVSAQGFASAALHTTMQHGDVTMMHPVSTLVVPARKMVTLAPGGMHIMLMNPAVIVPAGQKVAITARYKDGGEQTFELEVKNANDVKPSSHAAPVKEAADDHKHSH